MKKNKLTILISGVFDILCVDRSHYLMLILEINRNLRTPVRIELFNKGSLEIPRAHILWWWESHKDKNGRRRSSATSSSSSPVAIIYIIDFMLVSCANPELFPEEGFVCQDGRSPISINMLSAIKKYEISSGVQHDPSPSYGTFAT